MNSLKKVGYDKNPVRVITIYPEWIWAMKHLGKRVENRNWNVFLWLVGRDVFLHAGANIGGKKNLMSCFNGLLGLKEMAEKNGWNVEWKKVRVVKKVRIANSMYSYIGRRIGLGDPYKLLGREFVLEFKRGDEIYVLKESEIVKMAIVGKCKFYDTLNLKKKISDPGWEVDGMRHWWMDEVKWFDFPVEIPGKQGFWMWDGWTQDHSDL
jgi:hypothetical protein